MMTPASTSPAAVQLQSAFHEEEDERVSLLAQQPHKHAVERIITSIKQAGHIPCIYHSYELAGEIYEKFRNRFFLMDEATELLYILSQPNIRALFDVHDRVASKEYLPALPDLLPQCDDEDQAVKIVKLIKNNEPLGVTIKKRDSCSSAAVTCRTGGADGVIYIARVFVGGPAQRSGMIQVGDEVHEVNGIPVQGRNIEQVVHILNSCEGAINLKLIPAPISSDVELTQVKMRANFSYEPNTDLLIPCKDAGLAFKARDILEILNTDDPTWWQARHYYDHTNKTGLIPSRCLQKRRIAESVTDFNVPNSVSMIHKIQKKATCTTAATAAVQSNTIPHSTGSLLSPRQHRKLNKKSSTRKIAYQAYIKDGFVEFSSFDEELDIQRQQTSDSSLLYEEVELYRAPNTRPRPIVLVGINGVGKNDLKARLVRENADYVTPLPVTSRPKKILESDGKDYNFVSKAEMDRLIQSNRLMEYGEYKGHLYALTLDSIYEVICKGKVCVITCQPASLSTLRCSAIKPLVILIKPPNLDKLKQLKIYTGEKSTRKLTMNEMEGMVLSSARLESHYRKLCDEVIINTDYNHTYNQLISICNSTNTDDKWVPASWLT